MRREKALKNTLVLLLLFVSVSAAVAADPSGDGRGDAYAELIEARLAARMGTLDEVQTHLDAATRLQPQDPELHAEGAALLQLLGAYDDASAMARRALELQPDHPRAMRVLADLMAMRAVGVERDDASGQEAIRLYERLALDPQVEDEVYGLLANLKMHAGDVPGAVAAAQKFAERRPGDADATQLLARSLVRDGKPEEALDGLLDHLVAHPDDQDLMVDVYEIGRRSDDGWERIEEVCSRVVEAQPEGAMGRALHGQALLRLGRVEEAAAELEQALHLAPRKPAAGEAGFYSVARSHLLTAYDELGRLAEAAEVAHLLAAEYPNNVSVQMVLGEILAAQGDVQGALTAYATAIAAAGPQTMDGQRTRDDLRRRMASLQLSQARPEEAMRLLDQMERPDDPRALEARVNVCLLTGRLEEAERVVRDLKRIAGAEGTAALAEGEVLLSRGRVRKAVQHLDRAVALLGDDIRPRIADLLRSHKQTGMGEAVLRGWVEKEPEALEPRYRLGVYLDRTGSPNRAEDELWKILEQNPRHAPTLNYLGYALAERDGARLDEALTLVRRAVEVDRWNGAYRDSLGWILYRMGRLDEARAELEQAARCYPFDPEVLEHLGDLYAASGDQDSALTWWTRALEARPVDGEALRVKIQRWREGRSFRSAAPHASEGLPER
ncbi:MAG TPA: tetratricopeptide repeat protein [Candidatus Polarisedimenticolaceae bacterium]|nr:tetratricopeptide repeat protein [Candidatus Polarisedimenticolaceae bacterium]